MALAAIRFLHRRELSLYIRGEDTQTTRHSSKTTATWDQKNTSQGKRQCRLRKDSEIAAKLKWRQLNEVGK